MNTRLAKNDLFPVVATMLVGASEHVRLFSRYLDNREFGLPLEDIATIVDQRLIRECILPLPGFGLERDGSLFPVKEKEMIQPSQTISTINAFIESGWNVRLFPRAAILATSLVIDQNQCIYYEYLNEDPGPSIGGAQTSHYLDQFESHWVTSLDVSVIDTLYAGQIVFDLKKNEVIIECTNYWNSLLIDIIKDPKIIHTLTPRKFEEMIAELLIREGLEAHLTPKTRDGGRDILAFQDTPVGRLLYLVECKRNRIDRPVDVSVVRSLYGILIAERASAGMIVTSSYFSPDAVKFRNDIKHQMTLRDYNNLQLWIRNVTGK